MFNLSKIHVMKTYLPEFSRIFRLQGFHSSTIGEHILQTFYIEHVDRPYNARQADEFGSHFPATKDRDGDGDIL